MKMNTALNVASSWNDHAFFTISFLPDLFLENSCKVIVLFSYVFLLLLFLYTSHSAFPFQAAVQGIDRNSDIFLFLINTKKNIVHHKAIIHNV